MSQFYIDINLINFIDFEANILLSNGLLIVNQITKFNSEYIHVRANFSYQVQQELSRMQSTAE